MDVRKKGYNISRYVMKRTPHGCPTDRSRTNLLRDQRVVECLSGS
ncbi:hypothetical protein OG292_07075 [Streptomyces sp. NBC_01511]